jgi:hypothetical protein
MVASSSKQHEQQNNTGDRKCSPPSQSYRLRRVALTDAIHGNYVSFIENFREEKRYETAAPNGHEQKEKTDNR